MLIEEVEEVDQGTSQDSLEWTFRCEKKEEQKAGIDKIAKRVVVGAGARVLFYPTLFYNVVRNKLQAEFRWWDEVDQYLLLGAVPFPKDVQRLKELGVRGVVTLNESYETLVPTSMYQDQGIKHLVIPTRDYLFAPSFEDIRRAVEFIHENAICGKTTYVHCKAGRGRSTTIVLCYLVEYRQMTPEDAYAYVRSKRPRVLLAASQWQAVQEYRKQRNQQQTALIVPLKFTVPDQYPMMPLYVSHTLYEGNLTNSRKDGNVCYDESIVIVTSADLEGYRSIKDAGLIGNELWKELGVTYQVRFVAARGVMGMVRASAALARLSYLWLGCQAGSKVCTKDLPVPSLKSLKTLDCCSSLAEQLPGMRTDVPVCPQGIVNC
uniref:phosphatidylglycerophosphatase n=1 Tax=Araucaria cunninghamii TaxID=56994 RepID=A0A0D6QVV4_ARACU